MGAVINSINFIKREEGIEIYFLLFNCHAMELNEIERVQRFTDKRFTDFFFSSQK